MGLRKKVAGVFSLVMALVLLAGISPAMAQTGTAPAFTATPLEAESQFDAAVLKGVTGSTHLVSLLVKLDEQSVLSYEGGIDGLEATSPSVTGKAFDANAAEVVAYRAYLNGKIDEAVAALQALAPDTKVVYRYDVVLGGFAAQVPVEQLDRLARVPNVQAVYPDELRKIETYRSPVFMGAQGTWDRLGGQGSAGEGVVVGILDSGIWPEHPSFSDPDPLGKPYAAPPAKWIGTECNFGASGGPTDPAFDCNNKLVGAARFMETYELVNVIEDYEFRSARDDDGHGSHTASTSAGNRGVAVTLLGKDFGLISGVAPRAHVAAYKVCGELGCYSTDSAAAIQQSILDGVDVLNFSISGGANPYSDIVAQAFFDAYEAGIFVAASGGNAGPGAETVNHRGGWITTVAASTSDRASLSTATLYGATGTLQLTGASITDGISTPTPVVINTADGLCLNPAAPGSFTGKIVVCQRGVNARTAKSANVAAGGAVGMFLYNASPSSIDDDAHTIPAIHFQGGPGREGEQLLAFIVANPDVTATFTDGAAATIKGDVLAGFSSRGGPGQTLGISKPDITAPGVNILAAYTGMAYGQSLDYDSFLSGTSMSGPHVAGAGALLRDLYPKWTPGQIKSALMTTAKPYVLKEDETTPATPFDTGSGRVDLSKAWNPGITFDVPADDYITHKDDLWNVNYPSIYIPAMAGLVSVNRTARNVTRQRLDYNLRVAMPEGQPNDFFVMIPTSISIGANWQRSFNVRIDGRNVPIGETRHATIIFEEKGGSVARMPVTFVRKEPVVTVDGECNPAVFPRSTTSNCSITMANTTFDDAEVSMYSNLPYELDLNASSVTGGGVGQDVQGGLDRVTFNGTLGGAEPPAPAIGVGVSPAGYLPLSSFGVPPVSGVGDETATNFNVPAFVFAGQTYTRIGVVSNGYVVVGGSNGAADIQYINQNLPDPVRPNNVLAPFWTDLNPGAGGAIRVGTLTDGVSRWIVVDWQAVKEYSTPRTASFQIWIGVNGTEDISYTYGTLQGNGDLGYLTVGVENSFGNRGANYYADGEGTLPTSTTELGVTSVPGAPGETRTITFVVKGRKVNPWVAYANMTSPAFQGTNVARFTGEVTP